MKELPLPHRVRPMGALQWHAVPPGAQPTALHLAPNCWRKMLAFLNRSNIIPKLQYCQQTQRRYILVQVVRAEKYLVQVQGFGELVGVLGGVDVGVFSSG